MLSVEEALQRILEPLTPLGSESVAIGDARGRVAAESQAARRTLPPFDNSAMDGYAVRSADTGDATADKPVRFTVSETIPAGSVASTALGAGQAMRIFTGAPMPEGADAVVMQEYAERDDDAVVIQRGAAPGQHVRLAGDDVEIGQPLLAAGALIRTGDIGLLAAQGISWVQVIRRPVVAILPTGDEVVEIDRALAPGQIANSNSHMLAAQVIEAGGSPMQLPVAGDDPAALTASLRRAAGADLILTSGGVSVGELDFVRDVLDDAGAIDFWKVAIKPGKPLAYGTLGGTRLLGLPGNPVSSFVCFEIFARPAIRKLMNHPRLHRPRDRAVLTRDVRRNQSRRELLRGQLGWSDDVLIVEPLSRQGSGQLSSMAGVDALIDVAPGVDSVPAGEQIDVVLLDTPPPR